MCIWYGLMERQAHDRFFGTKLGVVTQPFVLNFFHQDGEEIFRVNHVKIRIISKESLGPMTKFGVKFKYRFYK